MRDKIWNYATRNVPEGSILPKHLFWFKCLLHPVQAMYWHAMPYDALTDVWTIEGRQYSGAAMRQLSRAKGLYRIDMENGIMEKIESQQAVD